MAHSIKSGTDDLDLGNGYRRMITLSDLYRQDVAEGSLFMLQAPISPNAVSDNRYQVPRALMNDSKYPMASNKSVIDLIGYETWKRYLCAGNYLSIFCGIQPPNDLVAHWRKIIGEELAWNMGTLEDANIYINMHPFQNLPAEKLITPSEVMHTLHDKKLIHQINCPQPELIQIISQNGLESRYGGKCISENGILTNENNTPFPWVVKAGYSSNCEGVVKVNTIAEAYESVELLKKYSGVTITKWVEDLVQNYCCHFYISRDGSHRFIGVNTQIIGSCFIGGCCSIAVEEQDRLEALVIGSLNPIKEKLHEMGFIGCVGVDLLIDTANNQYVIDINPRPASSSVMHFITPLMRGKGWAYCLYLSRGVTFTGEFDDLLTCIENCKVGDVIVLAYARLDADTHKTQVLIYSTDISQCEEIARSLFTVDDLNLRVEKTA